MSEAESPAPTPAPAEPAKPPGSPDRRRPLPSKATRSERRKLTASLANNVATAWVIAAIVQPVLGFAREARPLQVADAAAAVIFLALAVVFHIAARWLVGKLED